MPDFQKEKEKLFHVTKHDGEVVVRVYTLKNREEFFPIRKVSHSCHFEIRIEKIRIHLT
jgi:hypothetical protein